MYSKNGNFRCTVHRSAHKHKSSLCCSGPRSFSVNTSSSWSWCLFFSVLTRALWSRAVCFRLPRGDALHKEIHSRFGAAIIAPTTYCRSNFSRLPYQYSTSPINCRCAQRKSTTDKTGCPNYWLGTNKHTQSFFLSPPDHVGRSFTDLLPIRCAHSDRSIDFKPNTEIAI